MLRIILGASVIFILASACGKTDGPNSPISSAENDSAQLRSIEQECVMAGVTIKHESPSTSYSSRTYTHALRISWIAVGITEQEMNLAVQALRKYRVKFSSVEQPLDPETHEYLSPTDRQNQLDTVDSAIASVQSLRNELLTKSLCKSSGS